MDTRTSSRTALSLGLPGFEYADLHRPERLADLLRRFERTLEDEDAALFERYRRYHRARGGHAADGEPPRASGREEEMTAQEISDVLVEVAPHVSRFLARLFAVDDERERQARAARREMDTVFEFRQRVVARLDSKLKGAGVEDFDPADLERRVGVLARAAVPGAADDDDPERRLATLGARLATLAQALGGGGKRSGESGKRDAAERGADREQALAEIASMRARLAADEDGARDFADALAAESPHDLVTALLAPVERYTWCALHHPALAEHAAGWACLRKPARVDFAGLVDARERDGEGATGANGARVLVAPPDHLRPRDGFALTDTRYGPREVLYEVDHCIYCHDRDRDSCSKGMRHRDGSLHVNPLGVTLTGCPLEEKISEAHLLKRDGDNLGALALVTVDNPMVPGTGHRICNDCMKGCIYQKVEPVDIPQIETNILTDVLFMPWGFEIYSLLTRWNPLNARRPHALPYNGRNVLVVGLGPAGYTLAHYLLNEGFGVAGIDAFKLEPLPPELTGSPGEPPQPVRDFRELYEDLDARVMAGFGGVAEYGITVRWDKNFLKVIYLTLLRRATFACYGGVRFGGTLTVDDAWELGFDHVAIASGAGKPTVIGLRNNLIRGVRKASDFLMALQLTGAAKGSSLANLQVRLPAGVIGGGLTAIDTATELLAYYPVQVEKVLARHEAICARFGEACVLADCDEEERAVLEEFLAHGRAVRAERERARADRRAPDLQSLVREWGGVTIFYRRALEESPAYRQNHEEVGKCLEEGVAFAPGMNPLEAVPDEHGHLAAVRFARLERDEDGAYGSVDEEVELPMGSLFVAAGTSPNIIYENEHPGTFELDGRFFRRHEPRWDGNGNETGPELVPVDGATLPKVARPAPFTSYRKDGRFVTFFGDNHPVYAGNVVKAMASAKDGYPYIVRLFRDELAELDPARQDERDAAFVSLRERLDDELTATVDHVNRLTPTIVEVVARAPIAARKFHPGQFYRIQNLESEAPAVGDAVLAAEGLALTGAWVHKEKGLISLITLEMGTSSRLCALWRPGERIVVMGPTGTPTEIPRDRTVLLAGGGLGNAVLFSIGRAMREAGNRVVYFAGYKHPGDVFKVREIEEASDVVVWATDPGPDTHPIRTTRPQDKSFIGNIVEAMLAYARGDLGEPPIPMDEVDHIIAIGSDRMMAAIKDARHGVLARHLKPDHTAIGSINSSMQCMMKGICAQCLCKQVDPQTGETRFVYSCFNQDQPLDDVDFDNLHARLKQNSVQEKLSNRYLDYLLERYENRGA